MFDVLYCLYIEEYTKKHYLDEQRHSILEVIEKISNFQMTNFLKSFCKKNEQEKTFPIELFCNQKEKQF